MSTVYHSVRSSDEKVVITWKDLRFETLEKVPATFTFCRTTTYKKKTILNNLSGHAQTKELLAILGPTGCGKTSLLNVLAARVPEHGSAFSKLSGSVQVNGKNRNDEEFRKISAYVMQDDYMYAYLTVFETLMLSAHFFLPESLSHEAKVQHVDKTIAELGLVKARDTIIGNDKVRGVSGGERRRTSIAVQMLCDPAVLFLDEPTSGLDAFQSQAVMECMKKLALSGRLVIAVIHQPRSSIFDMFDKLLLLSEGNTMYYGDAKNAVEYFKIMQYSCPEDFNPSDFFLDLLSPDNRSSEAEEETKNRIKHVGEMWLKNQETSMTSTNGLILDSFDEFRSIKTIGTDLSFQKTIRNFFFLCWRSWTQQSRDKAVIIAKFVACILFALIIGGIYSNIGYDQRSIQNRKGVLFFILINQGFNSLTAVLNSFPIEKTIVNRERSGNAYSTLSYCFAKIFVEMPLNLLPILVYCAIVHPLIHLNFDTFGYFILICLFANFTCIMLGLAISAFVPTVEAANAIGPPFMIIGIIFGGFYIRIDSLPLILEWIPYISLFQWSYRSLITNEFCGLEFSCDSDDTSKCILSGEEVLYTLDFQGHSTSYGVFGLGMLMLVYMVALYIILELSRFKFVPLGFVGKKYANHIDSVSI